MKIVGRGGASRVSGDILINDSRAHVNYAFNNFTRLDHKLKWKVSKSIYKSIWCKSILSIHAQSTRLVIYDFRGPAWSRATHQWTRGRSLKLSIGIDRSLFVFLLAISSVSLVFDAQNQFSNAKERFGSLWNCCFCLSYVHTVTCIDKHELFIVEDTETINLVCELTKENPVLQSFCRRQRICVTFAFDRKFWVFDEFWRVRCLRGNVLWGINSRN